MTSNRAASSLLLLSLLTVNLPFVAAQRSPGLPGNRPVLPGAPPFSPPGQAAAIGGVPHRGPITPGELASAASQARVSPAQLMTALSSATANPIFFTTPTYGSGGRIADSVAVADVNGDGNADLLVANECADNFSCAAGSVSVLLGNGDGTFQAAVAYGSGGVDPSTMAVGDVNGDGNPDLVVANYCAVNSCSSGSVSVLLGNGDGTFQAAMTYGSGGLYSRSVALGDVNGDGKPDFVVTNQCAIYSCYNGSVSVLLGNGDGTFQAAVSYSSGGNTAYSVALADLNGDSKLDLVVANVGSYVGVLLGNGDGTFQAAVSYTSGGSVPLSIAIGDVNGDGSPDIAVANQCAVNGCPSGAVGVLLGNGDGTFQTAVSYTSGGNYAVSVAIGDLSGDGKLDLAVANQSGGGVVVLLGNGDGSFQAAITYSTGAPANTTSVAMGDVNGDGKPDLVATSQCADHTCAAGSVAVLLGNGGGTFQGVPIFAPGFAVFVAAADLNGDGKPDLVVARQCADNTCAGGAAEVLLGNGDGTFQAPASYGSGGQYAYSVVVGDVNGDGKPDLALANQCAAGSNCTHGSVGVLLGNGDGTFQPAVSYSSGGQNSFSLAMGDVNGDGKPDLVVASECAPSNSCSNGSVDVLLGNGDGSFQAAANYLSGAQVAFSVAVGDFNADGKLDVAVANECADASCTTGAASILLGNGDGSFQPAVNYSSGGILTFSLAVGDLNGDGKPDLVTTNECTANSCSTSSITTLLGNGDGTFQTALSTSTPQACCIQSLALADFDGDGKLDVASGLGDVLLLGNGDGTFQAPIRLGTYGPGLAVGDFNLDGKPDLAVANNAVAILLNIAANFHYATATSVTSSLNPAPGGQSVTFTATITPATNVATPGGVVTFYDGANPLSTAQVVNNQAAFSTSALALGTHPITAAYGGDSTYLASTSAVLNETINSSTTTTALISSLNPSTFNQSVTFTATVTPAGGGTPTGTVSFTDGPNLLGVVGLSGGQAILTTSALGAGNHAIAASYSGDSAYQGSTATAVVQSVLTASTTLGLTSSANPSGYNQTVTFTATLTPQFGGSATGSVIFKDGAATLGTGSVSGNQASLGVSTLTLGTHVITASYGGDSNFTGSSSGTVSQVVNKATTTTQLVSSLNPAFVTQSITYTATVTSKYAGTVGGSVIFKSGTTSLGAVTLTSGQASVTTSFNTSGNRSITVTYVGDANNAGSSSVILTEVVKKFPTTTLLASSSNPSSVGQSVTFKATVSSAYGAIPDGELVTFKNSGVTIGVVGLSGGVATLTTSALAPGTRSIVATYAGDTLFSNGTSATLNQVVNKISTSTALASNLNPSSFGQSVTFTATVTAVGSPTGTVTFKSGSTTLGTVALTGNTASLSTSTLAVGTHLITAIYNGDATFKGSTSPGVNQLTNKAQASESLASSQNPSPVGQSVIFTATVSSSAGVPTGTVTFKHGTSTLGTGTLSGGVATFTASTLGAGSNTITASYGGATNYGTSSASLIQVVQ